MSLFIQANVSALTAQQNFFKTELSLNKTMNQLSTGNRITMGEENSVGFGIAASLNVLPATSLNSRLPTSTSPADLAIASLLSQTANVATGTSPSGAPSNSSPQLTISLLA